MENMKNFIFVRMHGLIGRSIWMMEGKKRNRLQLDHARNKHEQKDAVVKGGICVTRNDRKSVNSEICLDYSIERVLNAKGIQGPFDPSESIQSFQFSGDHRMNISPTGEGRWKRKSECQSPSDRFESDEIMNDDLFNGRGKPWL
jgi:hypothetical protein